MKLADIDRAVLYRDQLAKVRAALIAHQAGGGTARLVIEAGHAVSLSPDRRGAITALLEAEERMCINTLQMLGVEVPTNEGFGK